MEEMTLKKALLIRKGGDFDAVWKNCPNDSHCYLVMKNSLARGFLEGRKSLLQDPRLKRMVDYIERQDLNCVCRLREIIGIKKDDCVFCDRKEVLSGWKELQEEFKEGR